MVRKWPTGVPKRRKSPMNLQQRMEIIEKLKRGVQIAQLSAEYNVSRGCIFYLQQRAEEVTTYVAENRVNLTERKVIARPPHKEMEDRLHSWLHRRKEFGYYITNSLVRQKAIEFSKETGGPPSFAASKSWLTRFKFRYFVKNLIVNDEIEDPNQTIDNNFVIDLREIMSCEDIHPSNLYNMSETGLSWKFLPRKPLIHSVENSTELRKNWVSITLCTNSTGTHKIQPVFISKYKSPRSLKHSTNRSPVSYKCQKNCWMDKQLFLAWYENEFKPSALQNQAEAGVFGKIILIVNDCRVDDLPIELQQDNRFRVIFFPLNSMSIMDRGIVEKTKKSFRHKMLRRVLDFPGRINEFYSEYDLKYCIDDFHEAWTSLKSVDIQKAWQKLLTHMPITYTSIDEMNNSEDADDENLRKVMEKAADKRLSQKEVDNWLSTVVKVENDIRDSLDKTSLQTIVSSPKDDSSVDKEKVKKMFDQLNLWCKDKPEAVQYQFERLKMYYEHKS